MYEYYFCITTAKEISDMKDTYENDILEAIKSFNNSSKVARTYKKIQEDTVIIHNDKFEFILETKDSIDDNLSLRHLHLLSRALLEVEGLNNYVSNKRFLKPLEIKSLQNDKDKIENKEITDCQVIKSIIDIFLENNKKNEDIRLKIKELVKKHLDEKSS